MAIKESALSAITVIETDDFLRTVTSAGASRNVTVSNLAKTVVESYTGSEISGSAQTIKAALDSLASVTGIDPAVTNLATEIGWTQD